MNPLRGEPKVPRHRRRMRWLDYAMLLAFVALVLIPCLGIWPHQERLRWRAAAALLNYERGDQTALTQLVELTEQLPNDRGLRIRVVELLLKQNKIAEAGPLIEPWAERVRRSDRTIDQTSYQILRHYATLLWLRGEDSASLEVVKEMEARLPQAARRTISAINELSYQRALTQLELSDAEADMYDLIYRKRMIFNTVAPRWLSYRVTVLVAGALLAHEVGAADRTLALLNEEIDDMRRSVNLRTRELLKSIDEELGKANPFDADSRDNLDRLRQYEAQGRADLAALLIARAYVLDRSQQREASQRDRAEVQQLGFDGDAWLAATPSHQVLLELVSQGGSLLDTYAYILYGQRRYGWAIHEQRVAIWAIELLVASYDTPLHNSTAVGLDMRDAKAMARYSLAVLYAHHAEMLTAIGLTADADAEFQKMESLGFDRNLILF